MNRTILWLASLAVALGSSAATLSPDQALQRAMGEASSRKHMAGKSQFSLVKQGELNGRANYYIFSNGNASMILSAEYIAVPVLGYLDRPVQADTQLPPQLEWWLTRLGEETQFGLDNGFDPSERKSGRRTDSGYQDVAPLVQTTWNQSAPYNLYAPGSCPTGCVATAICQVMNYYKYPEHGTGSCSATYNYSTYSLTLDDYEFDWDNMLDHYPTSGTGTTAQREAVARLMQCVGYAVKMQYDYYGSGAYDTDIVPALVDNFFYDSSAYLGFRDNMTPAEWVDLCYDEISNGRPLIYGGDGSSGGGHEFVCDGFRASDSYFHFNWGWEGSYDGYFTMSSLCPEGQGIGGNGSNFNYHQSAVMNLTVPGQVADPDLEGYIDVTYDFTDIEGMKGMCSSDAVDPSAHTSETGPNNIDGVEFKNRPLLLSIDRGEGSVPRWWKDKNDNLELRFYKKNQLKLSCYKEGYQIKQIVFNEGFGTYWNNSGETAPEGGKWTKRRWTAPKGEKVTEFVFNPTATCNVGSIAVKLGIETGVEKVIGEENQTDVPEEYYNLQGMRVDRPTHGIYIVKKGNASRKVAM